MVIQLSSFEVMRLVKELSSLEGSFLQKVYQPWEGLLVIRLNTRSGRKHIVHRVGRWLYVTDELDVGLDLGREVKGTELPGFVKLLRKHLSNAFVTSSRQLGFDRIIELGLRKELPYVIIFEMFGQGNVVLSRQGRILGALRTQVWRHRTIRGGNEYRPPPPRKDPREIGPAELAVLLNQSNADLVRTMATSVNLGGTYSEEVLHRAGLDKSMDPSTLGPDHMRNLLAVIGDITKEVSEGQGGYIHTRNGSRTDVTAIKLGKYGDEPVESFATLSQAVRARFPLGEFAEEQGPSDMEAIIERLRHQERQQSEALVRFDEEISTSTAKAEAIYINYKAVEEVLEQVNALGKARGWRTAMTSFPDLNIDPSERTVTMEIGYEGKRHEVTLDLTKGINENASQYYERAKHIREKVEGAQRALEETRSEISRLETDMEDEARRLAEEGDLSTVSRKRFWFESHRWFISRNGNVIIGGRDARSNQRLVKKYLRSGDRYVHADIHGAPSIVVKAADQDGKALDIPVETLEEACHYAICFSKAWSARIGSGEAYWVNPEQVSTSPQSGEFLPKGGFIIRGKRNLVRNLDLRLMIGLIEMDGVEVLMCAPVETMDGRATKSHIIVPSKAKKTVAAKLLAKEYDVPVDEIEALLPPGGAEVLGLSR